MSRTIIKLSPLHLDAVHGIALQSFDTCWKKEEFQVFLEHACGFNFGILENGSLAAYVLSLLVQGEVDTISLATAPNARKRGLAKALLAHIQTEPEVSSVFLEVDVSNTAAIALYERCGFFRMGVRKKYYASLRDALQMRWKRR